MKKLSILLISLSIFAGFSGCNQARVQQPAAKRVILIGIDGMGIDGFETAKTPNINALARDGALSLKTRGVMPTVSAPNWGSILLGAGPEQHGITSNAWSLTNYTIEPTCKDDDGYFPSVFKVVRDNKPMAKICSFYDWDGLGALYNHKYLDMDKLVTGYEKVFAEAIAYITGQKPDLSFIYVGHPDEVGHDIGWGSKEYYESIEQVDKLIGDLIKALKDNGMYDETYIIVVSDHGGVKKGHGSESMAEIQVPWIIKGPNTIKNRLMEQPNDNFNTAATIAWLFGAPLPDCWIGRPALGAFSDQEKFVNENSRVYVPLPGSSFPGGSSVSPVEVILFVEEPGMEIRYTLDGSTPVKESQLYENPVKIEQTSVLKAVAFLEGNQGAILEVPFTRVKSVQKVELKNEPGKQYQAQGQLSLFDGITASADYKDKAWLGFEGDNLNATIDLGTEKKVNYVIIHYLNNKTVWIYPPIGAGVDWSTDGKRFHKVARLKVKDIEKQNKSGINELKIDLKDVTARYLTIIIDNQGKCPKDHPGAGEKAWLFVDEIIIK